MASFSKLPEDAIFEILKAVAQNGSNKDVVSLASTCKNVHSVYNYSKDHLNLQALEHGVTGDFLDLALEHTGYEMLECPDLATAIRTEDDPTSIEAYQSEMQQMIQPNQQDIKIAFPSALIFAITEKRHIQFVCLAMTLSAFFDFSHPSTLYRLDYGMPVQKGLIPLDYWIEAVYTYAMHGLDLANSDMPEYMVDEYDRVATEGPDSEYITFYTTKATIIAFLFIRYTAGTFCLPTEPRAFYARRWFEHQALINGMRSNNYPAQEKRRAITHYMQNWELKLFSTDGWKLLGCIMNAWGYMKASWENEVRGENAKVTAEECEQMRLRDQQFLGFPEVLASKWSPSLLRVLDENAVELHAAMNEVDEKIAQEAEEEGISLPARVTSRQQHNGYPRRPPYAVNAQGMWVHYH